MSDKKLALQTIARLPDTVSLPEIVDELTLTSALREGIKQADEGKVRPHREVIELPRQWVQR
jgi:predicted transcriptional regulator